MRSLIMTIGAVWALVGMGNAILLPWGEWSSLALSWAFIFEMLIFILPGLGVYSMGSRIETKSSDQKSRSESSDKEIQAQLHTEDHYRGPIDSSYGPSTAATPNQSATRRVESTITREKILATEPIPEISSAEARAALGGLVAESRYKAEPPPSRKLPFLVKALPVIVVLVGINVWQYKFNEGGVAENGVKTLDSSISHLYKNHEQPQTPQRSSKQKSVPPKKAVEVAKFHWWREGVGSILMANITIKNGNDYAVKDIKIVCRGYGTSGTHIDTNKHTIYEKIPKKKTVTFRNVNMGFLNSQVSTSGCEVLGAKWTYLSDKEKSSGDSGIITLQKKLKAAGYYQGAIDGIYGPKTKAANRTFQWVVKLQKKLKGSNYYHGQVNGLYDRATEEAHNTYKKEKVNGIAREL